MIYSGCRIQVSPCHSSASCYSCITGEAVIFSGFSYCLQRELGYDCCIFVVTLFRRGPMCLSKHTRCKRSEPSKAVQCHQKTAILENTCATSGATELRNVQQRTRRSVLLCACHYLEYGAKSARFMLKTQKSVNSQGFLMSEKPSRRTGDGILHNECRPMKSGFSLPASKEHGSTLMVLSELLWVCKGRTCSCMLCYNKRFRADLF